MHKNDVMEGAGAYEAESMLAAPPEAAEEQLQFMEGVATTTSTTTERSSPSASGGSSSDEQERRNEQLRVVDWLRQNYALTGRACDSIKKSEVYEDYRRQCARYSDLTPFTATFFGKLVKRAFPAIKDMRKGPRGSAKQHYAQFQRLSGDHAPASRAEEREEGTHQMEVQGSPLTFETYQPNPAFEQQQHHHMPALASESAPLQESGYRTGRAALGDSSTGIRTQGVKRKPMTSMNRQKTSKQGRLRDDDEATLSSSSPWGGGELAPKTVSDSVDEELHNLLLGDLSLEALSHMVNERGSLDLGRFPLLMTEASSPSASATITMSSSPASLSQASDLSTTTSSTSTSSTDQGPAASSPTSTSPEYTSNKRGFLSSILRKRVGAKAAARSPTSMTPPASSASSPIYVGEFDTHTRTTTPRTIIPRSPPVLPAEEHYALHTSPRLYQPSQRHRTRHHIAPQQLPPQHQQFFFHRNPHHTHPLPHHAAQYRYYTPEPAGSYQSSMHPFSYEHQAPGDYGPHPDYSPHLADSSPLPVIPPPATYLPSHPSTQRQQSTSSMPRSYSSPSLSTESSLSQSSSSYPTRLHGPSPRSSSRDVAPAGRGSPPLQMSVGGGRASTGYPLPSAPEPLIHDSGGFFGNPQAVSPHQPPTYPFTPEAPAPRRPLLSEAYALSPQHRSSPQLYGFQGSPLARESMQSGGRLYRSNPLPTSFSRYDRYAGGAEEPVLVGDEEFSIPPPPTRLHAPPVPRPQTAPPVPVSYTSREQSSPPSSSMNLSLVEQQPQQVYQRHPPGGQEFHSPYPPYHQPHPPPASSLPPPIPHHPHEWWEPPPYGTASYPYSSDQQPHSTGGGTPTSDPGGENPFGGE